MITCHNETTPYCTQVTNGEQSTLADTVQTTAVKVTASAPRLYRSGARELHKHNDSDVRRKA